MNSSTLVNTEVDLQNVYSGTLRVKGIEVVGFMVLLEYFLLWIQKKPLPLVHENLISMSHALLHEIMSFAAKTVELNIYMCVWSSFRLFDDIFPETPFSFCCTLVLIDLGYYWLHRASHEIMLFWSIHQVHHSSDDFTVAVGLRHSALQNVFSWIFYLPLAFLGLPPSHMIFHVQLNLLYQTWIHTCSIEHLGPLELVLNTPSHHRVHHGSNNYCLDKNYGGIFIVWDYLFATYEQEKEEEEIQYGLVFQPDFWNPVWHQFFYLQGAWQKARGMSSWADFVRSLIKGPSWQPGSSWTGCELDRGVVTGRLRAWANSSIPINVYVMTHLVACYFFMTSFLLSASVDDHLIIPVWKTLMYIVFLVGSLSNIGQIYDGGPSTKTLELCRCVMGLLLSTFLSVSFEAHQMALLTLFSTSIVFWLVLHPFGVASSQKIRKEL